MSQNPAITIYDNFTRPAADIVKQFEVPTGYITDLQGRRGALDCGIKPLFEFPPIVGPALTVKTVPDDNLAVYAALGVARSGDVLVIAVDNWTGSCVVGDMVAAMYNNIGLAGVATDGAARDVQFSHVARPFGRATQHGFDARQQFFDAERFDDVVVRAKTQALHAVIFLPFVAHRLLGP